MSSFVSKFQFNFGSILRRIMYNTFYTENCVYEYKWNLRYTFSLYQALVYCGIYNHIIRSFLLSIIIQFYSRSTAFSLLFYSLNFLFSVTIDMHIVEFLGSPDIVVELGFKVSKTSLSRNNITRFIYMVITLQDAKLLRIQRSHLPFLSENSTSYQALLSSTFYPFASDIWTQSDHAKDIQSAASFLQNNYYNLHSRSSHNNDAFPAKFSSPEISVATRITLTHFTRPIAIADENKFPSTSVLRLIEFGSADAK